ncbi:endonuclease [Blastomonas aquatica]|uniref:Endonuclease n=2 Tax=Blastomonas aquatica TaxID=1510276 RepID=A0ABQ1JC12_9SPHN|nr:endonuclease [Blastomonas aquatica]
MASKRNGTLYLGVTSNLPYRAWQHRTGQIEGFTKKYRCHMLVWYEHFDDIQDARACEYRMKTWKRDWKIALIEKDNPVWRDLYPDLNR